MNIFDIYKQSNIDLKDFLENHYQVEWTRAGSSYKSICPFHADTKPSLSYDKKRNAFKCMVCDVGGDVINYVEKLENISNVDACKKVLTLENIYFEDKTSEPLSDDQVKKLEEEKEARRVEAETKKQQKLEEQKEAKKKAIIRFTKQAEAQANALYQNYISLDEEVLANFPNQSATFLEWRDVYLGYDLKQESLTVLNRTHNPNVCYNIKHKVKFEWNDENKSYNKNKRMDGKWISSYDSTMFAFPYDYFKQHKDDKVVICEGERDALNLLSYNINCLTLGGVTNSWEEHKELLKDKVVYIWFDNDSAGYLNALKKYREIEEVAQTVYIVLFFQLNNALPKKYDISDYLKDKNFETKEDIFEAITFSSYFLTSDIIDEIGEYIDVDIRELDKKRDPKDRSIYQLSALKEFKDIERIFAKTDVEGNAINIFEAKGELDNKEVDRILNTFKSIKKDKNYNDFKDTLLNSLLIGADDKEKELEKLELAFAEFANLKQTLLTNYRQTHIVDMVIAFIKMTNHTGYTLGNYKGMLTIWTGTHYEIIKEAEIQKFIMNQWFYHARIDIKKRTAKNVIEIVQNLEMRATNIDRIKEAQNDKRYINLLNGTLIISKRGKVDFKDRHDKKDGSTNILKFNYDSNADCPKWKKFLNRVLPDEKEQECLMQYIGYCLLPTHDYEAFLLLYGSSGANGKSVIMDTISSFFGTENISSLDLQNFHGHELEGIANKFINIGSEIDPRGLDKGQLSMLKKIVSPKDRLTINPKNKSPYQLESFEKPKLIFSTNNRIKANMDNGVFRRMLFFDFNIEIKDEEKIRDLSDRFKDELGGILNLALESLQTLIANGRFTKSLRMIENIEEYKDDINPTRRYVNDNIELDTDCMIPKKFLYHHYKDWTENKGHKVLSEQSFWQKIKETLPDIDTTGTQITLPDVEALEGKPRCVKGIYCNSNEVSSFMMDKTEIRTNTINLSIDTKRIILKDAK